MTRVSPELIEVPDFSLVVLIGATGSGKSTFAAKHFNSTEVISSDYCRGLVSDDENDQAVSGDAFDLVRAIAEKRLKNRRLTVIDATNVRAPERKQSGELKQRGLPLRANCMSPGCSVGSASGQLAASITTSPRASRASWPRWHSMMPGGCTLPASTLR